MRAVRVLALLLAVAWLADALFVHSAVGRWVLPIATLALLGWIVLAPRVAESSSRQ